MLDPLSLAPGEAEVTLPFCPLCGNVNPAELGPVTSTCLDGRACRARQAGVLPVNPDPDMPRGQP